MVNDIIVILIYVDDILFIGSNSKLVEKVIHQLVSKFALKDLREFNYFRDLEVSPSVEGLHLSLTKYIGNFLKKAYMVENKGCPTPISSLDKLAKKQGCNFGKSSFVQVSGWFFIIYDPNKT